MISVVGDTIVIKCDCHPERPMFIARAEKDHIMLSHRTHGVVHTARVGLDNLQQAAVELSAMIDAGSPV